MQRLRIGIVGCGAICRALVRAAESGKLPVRLVGVTSRTEKSAREFLSTFRSAPGYLSLAELITAADLIVEAAGGKVVPELAEKANHTPRAKRPKATPAVHRFVIAHAAAEMAEAEADALIIYDAVTQGAGPIEILGRAAEVQPRGDPAGRR